MTDTNIPMSPERDKAEIAESEARKRKIDLETKGLELDHDLKREQIRTAKATSLKEEALAISQKAYTDATIRAEEFTLLGNHYHHVYTFMDAVDELSVDACLAQLAVWDRQSKDCPMHIVINSPGGNVVAGFHLFDQIAAYSKRGGGDHVVTMTVRGYAASMAGILLQAADERIIGPRAYLLIHQVSSWAQGSLGDLKDKMKWLDMMCEQVIDLFMDRADTEKINRDAFITNWERKDWWLTAERALEFGFVDRIG